MKPIPIETPMCKDCLAGHEHWMGGAAMTPWYCNRCGEKHVSGSTITQLRCDACSVNAHLCAYCQDYADESTLPYFVGMKTPDEWLATDHFEGVKVLDPDGWDRKDFERTWAQKITYPEMLKRLSKSTVKYPPRLLKPDA